MNVAGQYSSGAPGQPPASGGRIAAIVLAAGSSTRMGRNKLLLELNGETVVRRAARTATGAGLGPVIVVTGHAHEAVAAQLHMFAVRTVVNSEYAAGQHTSVAAGVAALGDDYAAGDDDCAAAIIMLADMPFVTAAMLREVAARYRESGAPLVVSRYGRDVTAPPMLYDRSLFGELARMDARCGRQVVRRHRDEAAVVEWPAEALRDMDRPADYGAIRAELAGSGLPAGARPACSEPARG